MDMTSTRAQAYEEGARSAEGRSLAGLFSDLWRESTALVQDEIELATADIAERAARAGRGLGAVAAGGAILFAGFLVLLLAAVGALSQVLPPDQAPWLAPLIVGAVVAVIGAIALSSGRRKLSAESLKPHRALDSLRRDRDLAKEHLQ
jgi:hypothetical protein